MDKNFINPAIEVLTSEIARYNLRLLGFISNIEGVVTDFLTANPEVLPTAEDLKDETQFTFYKEQRLLPAFYASNKFSKFAKANKRNPALKQTFKSLLKKNQAHRGSAYNALWNTLFNFYWCYLFEHPEQYPVLTPSDLERHLYVLLSSKLSLFVTELSSPHSRHWQYFFEVMSLVTLTALHKWTVLNDDEKADIAGNVYLAFAEKLNLKEEIEKLSDMDAATLLGYAYGITRNMIYEHFRKNKKYNTISFDDIPKQLTEDDVDENEWDLPIDSPTDAIEASEAADLFLEVLFDCNHPLHKNLIGKYEEDVQILLLHRRDGLTYSDIVEQLFIGLSDEDRHKKNISIRKKMERVKHLLKSRFIKMVKGL